MLLSLVLSKIVIRTLSTRLGTPDVSPPNAILTVTSLESALPQNSPVTPLQSALPKSLDLKHLKPFRIRTYKIRWGEGDFVDQYGQPSISTCNRFLHILASLPHCFAMH